jgi:hypothetical protein
MKRSPFNKVVPQPHPPTRVHALHKETPPRSGPDHISSRTAAVPAADAQASRACAWAGGGMWRERPGGEDAAGSAAETAAVRCVPAMWSAGRWPAGPPAARRYGTRHCRARRRAIQCSPVRTAHGDRGACARTRPRRRPLQTGQLARQPLQPRAPIRGHHQRARCRRAHGIAAHLFLTIDDAARAINHRPHDPRVDRIAPRRT